MKSSEAAAVDPLGRILSYLVAIATIIGIPAGLYGYYAGQHDKRVEKTFEFYKTFRSAPVEEDWSLLIGRWNEKAKDAKAIIAKRDDGALRRYVLSLVAEPPGPKAIERVLSFFDELTACVNNSLCDRNTAHALFKEPAHQFAGAYGPYVLHVRQEFNNKKYGTGLLQTRALERSFNPF